MVELLAGIGNKFFKLWQRTHLKFHILAVSLVSYIYLDYLTHITGGNLKLILQFFLLFPALGIMFFLLIETARQHIKNKTKGIILMSFVFLISLVVSVKEFDGIIFLIAKDLATIPLIFSTSYLIYAIMNRQPDEESFPTFKKHFKKLIEQ